MTVEETLPTHESSPSNALVRVIRPILMVAAAVSLVGLSIHVLGIRYSDVLVHTLRDIKELIGWTPLLEVLEQLVKRAASYIGIASLQLGEWWRDTFVLGWLLNGAMTRNLSRNMGWKAFGVTFVLGGVVAFVAAIATGCVELSSRALVDWPLAGMLAFFAIGNAVALSAVPGIAFRRALPGLLVIAVSIALSALLIDRGLQNAATPMTTAFGLVVPGPGLAIIAILVCVIGLIFALVGLIRRDDVGIPMGRDIVGAFGIAALIAIIGLSL